MTEIVQRIESLKVPENSMGIVFMGQAGFILKSPAGQLIGVDLYLSNCCERYFGFKRLMPQLLLPGEIELNAILASHAHYDHFDVDSIPFMLSNNKTKLYVAKDCVAECERLGLPEEKTTVLEKGRSVIIGDFRVTPVPCDHGEAAPEAVGLLIECGPKVFYLVGDSCFRADNAAERAKEHIDVMAVPINGAFGNMNSEEAAAFAEIVRPELTVPCHYWNFARHYGNPQEFIEAMDKKNPRIPYSLMFPGETVIV